MDDSKLRILRFASAIASSHLVRNSFLLTLVIDMSILLSVMNDTDYSRILDDTLSKLIAARAKKNELEHEIVKLRQFFFATINMLSDNDRATVLARFDKIILDDERSAVGLKEAINLVPITYVISQNKERN